MDMEMDQDVMMEDEREAVGFFSLTDTYLTYTYLTYLYGSLHFYSTVSFIPC